MRNKDLFKQISDAVTLKKLSEPFSRQDAKYILGNSLNFLHKHRLGNGNTTELFERVGHGLYIINPKLKTST